MPHRSNEQSQSSPHSRSQSPSQPLILSPPSPSAKSSHPPSSPSVLARAGPILASVNPTSPHGPSSSSSTSPIASAPGSPLSIGGGRGMSPPKPSGGGGFSRAGSVSPPILGAAGSAGGQSPGGTSPPSPTIERLSPAFDGTVPPTTGGSALGLTGNSATTGVSGGGAGSGGGGSGPSSVVGGPTASTGGGTLSPNTIDEFLSFTAAAQAGHGPGPYYGHGSKPSISSTLTNDAETSSIFERDVEYTPDHVLSPHEAVDVAIPPVLTEAAELLASDESPKDLDEISELAGNTTLADGNGPAPSFSAGVTTGPAPSAVNSPHGAGSVIAGGPGSGGSQSGAVSPTGWSSPPRRGSANYPITTSGPGSSVGSPRDTFSSRSSPSPPPREASSTLSTPPTQYSPPVFMPLEKRLKEQEEKLQAQAGTGGTGDVQAVTMPPIPVSESDTAPSPTAATANSTLPTDFNEISPPDLSLTSAVTSVPGAAAGGDGPTRSSPVSAGATSFYPPGLSFSPSPPMSTGPQDGNFNLSSSPQHHTIARNTTPSPSSPTNPIQIPPSTLHHPQPRSHISSPSLSSAPLSDRENLANRDRNKRLSFVSYADILNEERVASSGPGGVVPTAGGVAVDFSASGAGSALGSGTMTPGGIGGILTAEGGPRD